MPSIPRADPSIRRRTTAILASVVMLATAGVLFAPGADHEPVPSHTNATASRVERDDAVASDTAERETRVAPEPGAAVDRNASSERIAAWTRTVPALTIVAKCSAGPIASARVYAVPESGANGLGDEFESIELGMTDEGGLLRASLRRASSIHAVAASGACSNVARFAPGDTACRLIFESTRARRIGVRDANTGKALADVRLAFLDPTRPSGAWITRVSDPEGMLTPDLPIGSYWFRSLTEQMTARPRAARDDCEIRATWDPFESLVVSAEPSSDRTLEPCWIDVEVFDPGPSLRLRVVAAESGAPLARVSAGWELYRPDRAKWSGGTGPTVPTDDGVIEVGSITRVSELHAMRVVVDAPGRRRAIVEEPRARIAIGLEVVVPLEVDPTKTPGAIELEVGDESVADALACCRGQEEFAAGKFERGVLRFSDLAPGEWLVGPYDLVRFARYSASGLEHLPLHRISIAPGETRRLSWDARWTPTERLAGRVDAIGIDPARLHVVADHGPLGAKIHLARDMRRVEVAADGRFEFRDLIAMPLRFVAVIVEPWGGDRVLAEGAIDRPLRVEAGSVDLAIAGLEAGGTALVELECSPGATELSVPTRLSLRVTAGAALRVPDLPVREARVRFMKAPHVPAGSDWIALALEAGATRTVTLPAR